MYNMILQRVSRFLVNRDGNTELTDIPQIFSMPLDEQGRKARHLCYHFSGEKDREGKEQRQLKREVMP